MIPYNFAKEGYIVDVGPGAGVHGGEIVEQHGTSHHPGRRGGKRDLPIAAVPV